MPLLGGLLVSLFTGLAQFLVQYVSRKTAVGLAAAAVLAGTTLAVFAALRTVFAAANVLLPEQLLAGFAFAIPPVAAPCMLSIATVWTACTLYAWQRRALDLFVKA